MRILYTSTLYVFVCDQTSFFFLRVQFLLNSTLYHPLFCSIGGAVVLFTIRYFLVRAFSLKPGYYVVEMRA